MRISDWSSDVCSSDLPGKAGGGACETGGDPARTRRAGALSARRRGDRRDPAQWRNEARLSWHPELCRTDLMHAHAPAARQVVGAGPGRSGRSEEHTSERQSLMRISYAVFCLKNKKANKTY